MDYEFIPSAGMELDGFIWSPVSLPTEGSTEVILQLADAQGRVFAQVALLSCDHEPGRYRYGVRVSEPPRLPVETASP